MDADITLRSLMATPHTLGFIQCATRTKCLHTSISSRKVSKRKQAGMFDAFGWAEENNTFLMHLPHISKKKEFGENSLVDIHLNNMG